MMFRNVKIILGMLFLYTANIFAISSFIESGTGGMGSGGGDVVICLGSNGETQSIELLDIYEQRVIFGLTPKKSTNQLSDEYIRYVKGQNPSSTLTDQQLINHLNRLTQNIIFVDDTIENIADEGPVVISDPKCYLQQIAYFTEKNADIFISRPLWNQLNTLNKMALIAHEHYWRQHRQDLKMTTSYYIRKHIGFSFMLENENDYQIQGTSFGICYSNIFAQEDSNETFSVNINPRGGVMEFLKSDQGEVFIRFHKFFNLTSNRDIYMFIPASLNPINLKEIITRGYYDEKLDFLNTKFSLVSIEPMPYRIVISYNSDKKLSISLLGIDREILINQKITFCHAY